MVGEALAVVVEQEGGFGLVTSEPGPHVFLIVLQQPGQVLTHWLKTGLVAFAPGQVSKRH